MGVDNNKAVLVGFPDSLAYDLIKRALDTLPHEAFLDRTLNRKITSYWFEYHPNNKSVEVNLIGETALGDRMHAAVPIPTYTYRGDYIKSQMSRASTPPWI